MDNKVILLTGTSSFDQEMVLSHILNNNASFVRLNQEVIFHKIVHDISHEYFLKDICFVEKVTGRRYDSYLDLLYFLQKTNNKKLVQVFSTVNAKSQLTNEVIIYRLYKEYFIAAQNIVNAGKNCIFIENVFNDPFPQRMDIFYDYFSRLGKNFKVISVYSSIQLIMAQTHATNKEFIKHFSSQGDAQKVYDELVNASIICASSYTLQNPLFNFELYPMAFEISKDQSLRSQALEVIKAKELKSLYRMAIIEMKKTFGFILLRSYPTFYQKTSILNEIGSRFLYIKEFDDEDELYILNQRFVFDYSVNLTQCSDIFCAVDMVLNACLLDEELHYPDTIKPSAFPTPSMSSDVVEIYPEVSPQIVQNIRYLMNSDKVFCLNDVQNNDIDYFDLDKNAVLTAGLEYFFFLQTDIGWIPYVLLVQKSGRVKLYYNTNAAKNEINFIFINNLYINLHKIINKHFFIDTLDFEKNAKRKLIKTALDILHYGHNTESV